MGGCGGLALIDVVDAYSTYGIFRTYWRFTYAVVIRFLDGWFCDVVWSHRHALSGVGVLEVMGRKSYVSGISHLRQLLTLCRSTDRTVGPRSWEIRVRRRKGSLGARGGCSRSGENDDEILHPGLACDWREGR